MSQGDHGDGEENGVTGHLLAIVQVRAFIEPSLANLLMQNPIFARDFLLDDRVYRGKDLDVPLDLLLDGPVGVLGW